MPTKPRYVVRVVLSSTEADACAHRFPTLGNFLECLRYMGTVVLHRADEHGMCLTWSRPPARETPPGGRRPTPTA
jgi:hypothetical protein